MLLILCPIQHRPYHLGMRPDATLSYHGNKAEETMEVHAMNMLESTGGQKFPTFTNSTPCAGILSVSVGFLRCHSTLSSTKPIFNWPGLSFSPGFFFIPLPVFFPLSVGEWSYRNVFPSSPSFSSTMPYLYTLF